MEKDKRVKKATVKDLKEQIADMHEVAEVLTDAIEVAEQRERALEDNNTVIANILSATREELGQAQELLLNQATTINKLQDKIDCNRGVRQDLKEEIDGLVIELHKRAVIIEKLNIDIKKLYNGEAPEATPPTSLYRVTTNGKKYAPEVSKDGGDSWHGIRVQDADGFGVFKDYRTYRGAMEFLRKQYGTEATILPREWRAV